MAAAMGRNNFLIILVLVLFYITLVQGDDCPQQPDGSAATNEKARNLAGSGLFDINDPDGKYRYQIVLCATKKDGSVAIRQIDKTNPNVTFVIGYFKKKKPARVFGGTDWLMIQYFGDNYNSHCGNSERKAIFYIECDRSANTEEKRKPRILEEYRPDKAIEEDKKFCYYLFEMKHDGVCPPEGKTKISPGSVFIIIVVIVAVLYLVLGFLYQRFIVGAKGMEQIPNHLMWKEFGTLQADGCNYVCRCKGTREPTRYKPMDDAIADEEDFNAETEDNDDAMLPM